MTLYNWNFDAAHSEIGFSVKHMMIAKVRGKFADWTGEFRYNPEDPTQAWVRADIDVSSIDTGNGQRDEHLRSPDFFDTSSFPQMTFESTDWRQVGDDFEVDGELTIKDVTRPITVYVESNGTGTDPWGNTRAGFSATAKLNRKDFGLTWNQALETGGVLVGDEVKIELEVQAIQGEAIASSAA